MSATDEFGLAPFSFDAPPAGMANPPPPPPSDESTSAHPIEAEIQLFATSLDLKPRVHFLQELAAAEAPAKAALEAAENELTSVQAPAERSKDDCDVAKCEAHAARQEAEQAESALRAANAEVAAAEQAVARARAAALECESRTLEAGTRARELYRGSSRSVLIGTRTRTGSSRAGTLLRLRAYRGRGRRRRCVSGSRRVPQARPLGNSTTLLQFSSWRIPWTAGARGSGR